MTQLASLTAVQLQFEEALTLTLPLEASGENDPLSELSVLAHPFTVTVADTGLPLPAALEAKTVYRVVVVGFTVQLALLIPAQAPPDHT